MRSGFRVGVVIAIGLAALGGLPATGQTANECDAPGDYPDVIVGDLFNLQGWGQSGGISAFSVGTYSCNIGTCWLAWINDTSEHPVIGQNMFRLADGRFEQIGQSWLKHGFTALSLELCDTGCVSTEGDYLGVNCADPYDAGLNGFQFGLGPKFEVNAATGEFPYPFTGIGLTGGAIYKRLQVDNQDLDLDINAGARYFVEGQYVTADDAAAERDDNNASWREVAVQLTGGRYQLSFVGETVRESPAIEAWAASDPAVNLRGVTISDDGLIYVGSRATDLGRGWWHYEYAIQNLNSHRGLGAVRVPIPLEADLAGVSFHDVRYHSGEPFVSDDWPAQVVESGNGAWIEWRVPAADPDVANALRWGTLYNFRFDTTRPPAAQLGPVELEPFRLGVPAVVLADHVVPQICDDDGVCDGGETCLNCPGDCSVPGVCGDGVCQPAIGESCIGCPQDCEGVQSGNPAARFCCGDGAGEGPVDCGDPRCTSNGAQCDSSAPGACCGDGVCQAGEDPCACEADCGPCPSPCSVPADCDDGLFCNGPETCDGSSCVDGTPPCGGALCDESTDACVPCLTDDHCDDGVYCNGRETCVAETCVAGEPPCPLSTCNELDENCLCATDLDCDDGLFCNGQEECLAGECLPGDVACLPPDFCDDDADVCIECTAECDDGLFCTGVETCMGDSCLPGDDPCPGETCNETYDTCGECASNVDCADGSFCTGVEICDASATCQPGGMPCPPGDYCDESVDQCVVCEVPCDDGNFCNGVETCLGTECLAGVAPCPDLPCDETANECVAVVLQPRPGEPLGGLSAADATAFDLGRVAFERAHAPADGLGPAYNGASCASCHDGGAGDLEITLFGRDDGQGGFDPLVDDGGPLLQAAAVSTECAEEVPPAADVVVPRLVPTHLGVGLVEAIADDTILLRESSPPGSVSGRSTAVEPLDAPGSTRVGRFGAKLERATIPSLAASELRDQIGVTSTLVPQDAAPGGDSTVLATCDGVADPEDELDATDDVAALVDYLRFLAPPAQTPATGMTGEATFSLVGCGNCHVGALTTPGDPGVPAPLRDRTVRAYSDFLVHDMGDAGDGVSTAVVERQEMRTAPLWGLRYRDRWWHDGRIAGGSFADRVQAAIEWHDRPGSEAAASAQSLLALPQSSRDRVVEFLESLGRIEFDGDGDGDLDEADLAEFVSCYGATAVTANHACAVQDHDRDGDVDDRDYLVLAFVSDVTIGGSVPDGADVPGTPLTVERAAGGAVTVRWGESCGVESDYEVYEGPIGAFHDVRPVTCSTGGATEATFVPDPGGRFFLVAPTDGVGGGSIGRGVDGRERPETPFMCRRRVIGNCGE